MKKGVIAFVLVLMLPLLSASLASNMALVNDYITQYNSGTINAPQLVVYLDYIRGKMYEELDKEGRKSFTQSEIEDVFTKVEKGKHDFHGPDYEKRFVTDDFEIVFATHRFYEYDESYWEKRESEADTLYGIYYELRAFNVEIYDSISEQVDDFVDDFLVLVESGEDDVEKEEKLRKQWNKIKQKFWNLQDQDKCIAVMEDLGLEEEKEHYGSDKKFFLPLKQVMKKDCWHEPGECHEECEEYEVCDDCEPYCHMKDECWEHCEPHCEEVCEEVDNETVCEDVCEEVCEERCEDHEVCEGCEESECRMEKNCWSDCDDKGDEVCNEWPDSEIRLEGNCREDGSDLWISAWGQDFEKYQGINDGGDWNCDSEIEALVKVRKVLQKNLNEDFAVWYFEEFLAGDDYDKILNGGGGFYSVLEMLIRNEDEIGGRLHCYEPREWPAGFERIEFEYDSGNAHVEVWEKLVPVEWDDSKYYTTLFKYSWVPDKELMKGLIDYKIGQTNDFGPSAKEIAEMKNDEGQMEVITSLAKKYGGSFDIKLELSQEDSDFAVMKYLQINPEVAVQMTDTLPEGTKPDISVSIDFDVLHNFISYMTYEMEGDRIHGPHWVKIDDHDEGPGKFFSVVGAVSKMWKEGIKIKPRYALLKLFFNTGDLIALMKGPDKDKYQDELLSRDESKTITGEAIKK